MPVPRVIKPEQVKLLVAAYERLGNISAAAREVGMNPSNARYILQKYGTGMRSSLYARACAEGVQEGFDSIRSELARLDKRIRSAEDDHTYIQLAKAKCDVVKTLIACDERVSARRTEYLERELLRTRIALLRGGVGSLANATDEELAALNAIVERIRARGKGEANGGVSQGAKGGDVEAIPGLDEDALTD